MDAASSCSGSFSFLTEDSAPLEALNAGRSVGSPPAGARRLSGSGGPPSGHRTSEPGWRSSEPGGRLATIKDGAPLTPSPRPNRGLFEGLGAELGSPQPEPSTAAFVPAGLEASVSGRDLPAIQVCVANVWKTGSIKRCQLPLLDVSGNVPLQRVR